MESNEGPGCELGARSSERLRQGESNPGARRQERTCSTEGIAERCSGFPQGRGKRRHEESMMEFWCWEYCSDKHTFGDPFKEVTGLFYSPFQPSHYLRVAEEMEGGCWRGPQGHTWGILRAHSPHASSYRAPSAALDIVLQKS